VREETWLGSFPDPHEADEFLHKQALRLKGFMLAPRFGLYIKTDKQGHHVYLVEHK
jgi:hypothetical protein